MGTGRIWMDRSVRRKEMFKTKLKQIKGARDLQKQSLQNNPDDYMMGLYNGLEMATAILEGREPEFETCVKEPPVIENKEEQTGRTVASGIRRR